MLTGLHDRHAGILQVRFAAAHDWHGCRLRRQVPSGTVLQAASLGLFVLCGTVERPHEHGMVWTAL